MSQATSPAQYRVRDYGAPAALVEITAPTYEQRWRAARSLGQALRAARLDGMLDVVATYETVVVFLDPLLAGPEQVRSWVAAMAGVTTPEAPATRFTVPVLYGDDAGPDLVGVADELGIGPDELVELHTTEDWTIRFVGSPVAAPFLDGPPLPAAVRRLAEPRPRVPAGSLAVSGQQSMIYSAASPGGWRLIGRTPCILFELTPPHVPYRPGDLMRFIPISAQTWDAHTGPLRAEHAG